MHLRPRDSRYQWEPALIDEDVVFAAQLATIGRIPTCMLSARWRRHASSVNACPIPFDLVMLAKQGFERDLGSASTSAFR